jgi:hypothetical protein
VSNLSAQHETLLRRWIAGELTRREEAELEALAREDDFLAAALAGLRAQPAADHAAAVDRLRGRLQERRRTGGSGFAWRRLAAAVLLLCIAAAAFWLGPKFAATAESEIAEAAPEVRAESPPVAEDEAPLNATPPAPAPSPRQASPTVSAPLPAPRQERIVAAAPAPSEAPLPADPPVARRVPPNVLPEAPPPPPPPPASARVEDATFSRTAAAEQPAAESVVAGAPARPVPYSVGAQAIAPDTPNAVPTFEGEEAAASAKRSLAATQRAAGTARVVRGYVRDEAGTPLPGVMVTTAGVPAGLFTDSAGYFSLRIDQTVDRLIFQNTGYAAEEIAVEGNDAYFEITLDDAVTESVSFDEAFAKTTIVPDDRPTMVSPPGGYRQLRRQLRAEKPAELPAGRVRLEFTVTEAGELRRFRVLETPDKRLSRWLVDRLRQTGAWTFYHGEGPHTVRYSVKFE